MMLMVTSSWDLCMLHPCGLVPKLLGPWYQFRGDWSRRIAIFTSEFDSNTFAGEEIQRHLSYYFFSLTTDMKRVSKNPRVPAVQPGVRYNTNVAGVRVRYFFAFWLCVVNLNPLSIQSMATLKEGDQRQMWEFIRIWVRRPVKLQASLCILWFLQNHILSHWHLQDDTRVAGWHWHLLLW